MWKWTKPNLQWIHTAAVWHTHLTLTSMHTLDCALTLNISLEMNAPFIPRFIPMPETAHDGSSHKCIYLSLTFTHSSLNFIHPTENMYSRFSAILCISVVIPTPNQHCVCAHFYASVSGCGWRHALMFSYAQLSIRKQGFHWLPCCISHCQDP